MKVTFAAMGAENISTETLSAVLKEHGHETELAFDRSLFDDANYFPIPLLARLLDTKDATIDKIVRTKPDLVAFSVFANNYQWALYIAKEVKKRLNVPVIFGGIHPTTCPDRIISNKEVDIICVGEGVDAIVELADSMQKGAVDYSIKNLWFKKNGHIIRNAERPLMDDLDKLPLIDKTLFENELPISDYYMTMTSRGCPYSCAFCSQSFLHNWATGKGKFYRERSVDSVINEFKVMKARYNIKRIDIKNNVLSNFKDWTFDFLRRYKKEIGLPFRIMGHPQLMDDELAMALKDAGCWHVQMGIQTMNQETRKKILNRHETNEEILNALQAMDNAGLGYSVDIMLGLPGETEEDLLKAINTFSNLKSVIRISTFWLDYLPKVKITYTMRETGVLSEEDIEKIESGQHENYLSTGSVTDESKITELKNYHLVFRLIPILPRSVTNFIVTYKLHKLFRYFPQTITLITVDVLVSILKHDHYAIWAIKTYLWEIKRRFVKKARRIVTLDKDNLEPRTRPVT